MTGRSRPMGLRHVALRTTELDASVDFYTSGFGLELVERTADVAWLRASGPEHHVLQLHRHDVNALHHVSLSAQTPADVDELCAMAEGYGATVVRRPGPLEGPMGGYGFHLLDLEQRLLEVSAQVRAVVARPADVPVPQKVAHVVLNTVDIDRATEFYTGALGLRVSDWSEHQMVFLRGSGDHHVIALNQAQWSSVNHVAYEVASLDHWLRSIGRLRSVGSDAAWGPGRHGPGNNAFAYYVDPAGLVAEVTAEVLMVDESTWQARVWPRTPELADQFGTAGPPSAAMRERMAGVPDAGWEPGR